MVQYPSDVPPSLWPLPSFCHPQTLHDLKVKLSIDSLTARIKLMMNGLLTRCSSKFLMFQLAEIAKCTEEKFTLPHAPSA
jgi:hypothetical protein